MESVEELYDYSISEAMSVSDVAVRGNAGHDYRIIATELIRRGWSFDPARAQDVRDHENVKADYRRAF